MLYTDYELELRVIVDSAVSSGCEGFGVRTLVGKHRVRYLSCNVLLAIILPAVCGV